MNEQEGLIVSTELLLADTERLLAAGVRPSEVAGCMVALALKIYKTVLSEQDFNAMIDDISASRGLVVKIEQNVSSSKLH